MSADAKWYVVHTYSGYENKVATNIEKMVENRKMQDQILEVQIPTEIVTAKLSASSFPAMCLSRQLLPMTRTTSPL
mgnify:CR=1 FL=1